MTLKIVTMTITKIIIHHTNSDETWSLKFWILKNGT